MTEDKMQDVFPIQYEYKEGEQPTARKQTAVIKNTDSAFSSISQAIGDPWDYASHTNISRLSVRNLGQTSLARILGPSDFASPMGGCWNEQVASNETVTLKANKTSWTLGFPLVKTISQIDENSTVAGSVTPLTWGTDITVIADPGGILTTRKTTPEQVDADGDFYVNFYKGTIIAYAPSSVDITIQITNINMFGPGVPWGTSNVIPTWENTTSLCNASQVSTYVYTLTLPVVYASQRTGTGTLSFGKKEYDASFNFDSTWNMNASGAGTQYRLPQAITSLGLSTGDSIPDGYLLLWSEQESRLIPNITFQYKDANSVTIVAAAANWLTEGDNYRLLCSGTGITEAISYLFEITRNNNFSGLNNNNSLSYSMPLSHDLLENRFSGTLLTSYSDIDKYKFRESGIPFNCHPQYLHRSGYNSTDEDGNSANALRGDLVFTSDDSYKLGGGASTTSGQRSNTYGIYFGGHDTANTTLNTRIAFEGGEDVSTWLSGVATRIGFGINGTGAMPLDLGTYGATTITPWQGTPLYLKGSYQTSTQDAYKGSILGFDLARFNELNYIKLFDVNRNGTYDEPHIPANTGSAQWTLPLRISSDSLSNRLSDSQLREFRFRAVSYIPSAINEGLETTGNEHEKYFTSPGVVGADFINIYSNAIFFSDTGDGTTTSLHDHISNWLDFDSRMPTGLYFNPKSTSYAEEAYFEFTINENSTTYDIFRIGARNGVWSQTGSFYVATTTYSGSTSGNVTLNSAGYISLDSVNDIILNSADDISITATDNLLLEASDAMTIETTNQNMTLTSGLDLIIYSGEDIDIDSNDSVSIDAVGTISLVANIGIGIATTNGDLNMASSDDVNITADSTVSIEGNASSGNNIELIGTNIFINTSSFAAQGLRVPALYNKSTAASRRDLYVDSSGYVGVITSSARYKENINIMDNINWLYDLIPVTFNYKSDLNKITEYGLIAENVNEINKLICSYDEDELPETVIYSKLITPMLKALQEQKKEIDELKIKINKWE